MWPLHVLNLNVLKAQGHSALNARIQLIKIFISVSLLLISSPYGLLAIAIGQIVASTLALFINTHYSRELLGYGWLNQMRDVAPYLGAAIPLALTLWVVRHLLSDSLVVQLISAPILGVTVYLLICRIFRLRAYDELAGLLTRKVKK